MLPIPAAHLLKRRGSVPVSLGNDCMPTDYLSQAKVLIVDDEPANVRLLERILTLSGCSQVQTSTDSRKRSRFMARP